MFCELLSTDCIFLFSFPVEKTYQMILRFSKRDTANDLLMPPTTVFDEMMQHHWQKQKPCSTSTTMSESIS